MRIVHILRKPLSEGTVAANVLKHGAGGLNIDASRITTEDNLNGGAYAENPTHRAGEDMWTSDRKGDTNCFRRGKEYAGGYEQPKGRWPANVILQHLDGCRCDGTKKVGSGLFVAHDAVVRTSTMMDPDKGWNGNSLNNSKKNAPNSYGKETVANWICEPGCPVARLDEQSGERPSGGSATKSDRTNSLYEDGLSQRIITPYKDKGGASRFFKQTGGQDE